MATMMLISTSNHCQMQTDMILLLLIEKNPKVRVKSMFYEISKDGTRSNILEQIKDFSRWWLITHADQLLFYLEGVQPTPEPPTPFPTQPPGVCVDFDERCKGWADDGYCDSINPKYKDIMDRKCCASCKG